MRACPAGSPVKAHAPAVSTGFQHPASAVAPSGHRGGIGQANTALSDGGEDEQTVPKMRGNRHGKGQPGA